MRELGGSDPITPDTLMMIGSITKPMTATMAATVVDDGKLTWDTPVVQILPEFAVADPALTERLSIRNAFCACTGLPQRDPEFLFNSDELTPERLSTSVKDYPLTAPLGEQFQYSNQLFAIGGYAAAAAAEQQSAELQRQLGDIDPAAVAPYLGRYVHDVLGEVEIAQADGVLIFDAGEFRAELRGLSDAGMTYLTSDLPLPGPATVTFTAETGTLVMTFTDPTTGEAYRFAFVGADGPEATPAPE